MKNFYKSKFFIITVSIALVLTFVVSALAVTGHTSFLTSIVNYTIAPFQRGAGSIGLAINGYRSYFSAVDELKKENEDLKQELEEVKSKVYGADALIEENEFYKSFLGIKEDNPDFVLLDAGVIGREAGNYTTVFSLDKGTKGGIEKNMPIVAPNGGLMGYIADAGINWSKAYSIIDPSSSVGVYVERSAEVGVLRGDYELQSDGMCRIDYLDENADIQPGDRIVTSGLGSIYPSGMPVGYVESIEYDDNLRAKYAIVRPIADLTSPQRIMVITSFQANSD